MSKVWKTLLALVLVVPVCYRFAHRDAAKTPDGKTIVRYMAWGYPSHIAVEKELIAQFEALPENRDVKVEFIMAPMKSYFDKLQLMLASGTAPDLFRINPNYYWPFIRNGYLKDLDGLMEADPTFDLDDFFDVATYHTVYQGRHYGVGVIFGTHLIYYNKALFERAGVKDPWTRFQEGKWTWADFLETAKLMTVFDENGRPVQYGTNFGAGTTVKPLFTAVAMVANAYDGRLTTSDYKKSLANSPEVVAAIDWVKDAVRKWKVAPTPEQSAMSVFTFESGKIAMEMNSSGESPRFAQAIKAFPWDVAPVPLGPTGIGDGYGGHLLVMNNGARAPEAAWRFMKFMVSEDAERVLGCKLRRCIPTRKSVAYSDEYLKAASPPYNMRAFVATMTQEPGEFSYDERFAEWSIEFINGLDRVFFGGEPTQQVMDETAAKIDEILNKEED